MTKPLASNINTADSDRLATLTMDGYPFMSMRGDWRGDFWTVRLFFGHAAVIRATATGEDTTLPGAFHRAVYDAVGKTPPPF